MAGTEPWDVVLALRRLEMKTSDEVFAWLNTPNADLDGLTPSLVVQRGRYDDAIRAIVLEVGRRRGAEEA